MQIGAVGEKTPLNSKGVVSKNPLISGDEKSSRWRTMQQRVLKALVSRTFLFVFLCILLFKAPQYLDIRNYDAEAYKGSFFQRIKEMFTDTVPDAFQAIATAIKTNKHSSTFVHLHIPKTGGQRFFSLFYPLWEVPMHVNCGASSTCCVDGEADEVLGRISKHPTSACSGNFFSYEMEYGDIHQHLSTEIDDGSVKVLLMLRDPQALFRSQIYHNIDHGHCDTLDKEFGACARNYVASHGGDIQTRRLDLARGDADGDLAQARRVLGEKVYWFGFTEYYDESLCVLAYQLGTFDAQACSCSDADGTSSSGTHLRKFNARGELHPHAQNEDGFSVEAVTQKDQKLYDYAFKLFMEKVDAIEQETGVRVFCRNLEDDNGTLKDDRH